MHIEKVQQEQVRIEGSDGRRMTKSELMGAHTHATSGGANKIHIWPAAVSAGPPSGKRWGPNRAPA